MDNKNIIIILIIIIVILAAAIGFTVLNPMHAKEPTKIKITSADEQDEGGNLSIQLTDLNKTPLSKEIVNITITDGKGKVVVDDVVKTNSTGEASLDLKLEKGDYNVTVSYGGNENYTGNDTTQKLTIKEKEIVAQTEESSNANEQNNQELEFNGKTHEQNVQDAKDSRDRGGQWAGASDEQIEEGISKIERDGGMV